MKTKGPNKFLSYGRQFIDQSDIDAVSAVLKSDYLTTGPAVAAFENALADRINEKHVICVNSGTAALHVAMAGLGIGPGDWVIVPGITFLASANAARWCGADVIFADVDAQNGLMTPAHLQQAIERHPDKKIKAVVPVHLTGQTENVAAMANIARAHDLRIIEDACHAFGGEYIETQRHYIGHCQQSDAVVFSFHPVKTIAMGEGGAITTRHDYLYEAAMRLRNHGMNRDPQTFLHRDRAYDENGTLNPWYYEMPAIGLNYRVSDINCALGLSQLKKLPRFIEQRRKLTTLYDELLKPLSPMIVPIKKTTYSDPVLHLYSVLIDFASLGMSRAALMRALQAKGIGTQVHYIPVNEQPYYKQRYPTLLVGANSYYEKTLSLPLYPAMEVDDVRYVVNTIKDMLRIVN